MWLSLAPTKRPSLHLSQQLKNHLNGQCAWNWLWNHPTFHTALSQHERCSASTVCPDHSQMQQSFAADKASKLGKPELESLAPSGQVHFCLYLSKQATCHSLWGLNYVTDSRPFPSLPLANGRAVPPGPQSTQQVTTARMLQPSCFPPILAVHPSSGEVQLKPHH